MTSGPAALSGRVGDLCDALLALAQDPRLREDVAGIAARLAEPLRVAVAGRVSSGKSTLVNALLGRAVAPTGAAETTRVVSVFRMGFPERIVVHLLDGSSQSLNLTRAGRIPDDPGVPTELIDRIEVFLSEQILEEMTLIDTPGLGAATSPSGARTLDFLGIDGRSSRAAAGADALIFVLNGAARREEVDTVAAFRALSGGTRASAATAIAVLTKADRMSPDVSDPWTVAKETARRHEGALRGTVAAVVPVIGLLAQTAGSGALGESEAQAIAELSHLDAERRETMFLSGDMFLREDAPVPPDERARLLEILDLYGTRRTVELAQQGTRGAAALRDELLDISGMRVVRSVLRDVFSRHADALKAAAALTALDRALHREGLPAGEARRMRADLERVRLDPEMYRLGLLVVLERVGRGELFLADEEVLEVRALASEEDPRRRLGLAHDAEESLVAEAAVAGVTRWKLRENAIAASPAEQEAAALVRRTYEHLWAASDSTERWT